MHFILMTRRAYKEDVGDAKIRAIKHYRDGRLPGYVPIMYCLNQITSGPQFLRVVPSLKSIADPRPRPDANYERMLSHEGATEPWGCVITAFGFTT